MSLAIEFGEGAEESFSVMVNKLTGWLVEVTPEDGSESFDAIMVGNDLGSGWYDAVRVKRSPGPDHDTVGPEEGLRVNRLKVY